MPRPSLRRRWTERLRRLWFTLSTLAVRARFFTGKASFVEADVAATTHWVGELRKESGRADALLAHYQLTTRKPRTGSQGWRLFEERVGPDTPHRTVRLECPSCGHHFIVQILSRIDPLASDATGGRPPGRPACYSSDWFRFMHESFTGEPSLYCAHCEQQGAPEVSVLVRGA